MAVEGNGKWIFTTNPQYPPQRKSTEGVKPLSLEAEWPVGLPTSSSLSSLVGRRACKERAAHFGGRSH